MLGGGAALAMAVLPAIPGWGATRRSAAHTALHVLNFFDTLALMRGDGGDGARPCWVRKWTRPVAVCLGPGATAQHYVETRRALKTLRRWTGLPFALAHREEVRGNLITIDILPHREMVERYGPDGAVCMTETFGRGGRLHTGRVEVSERYCDCLGHELMHAIGFDNHWRGAGTSAAMPSVLAPRFAAHRVTGFSPWDELAVRLLYHPRMRPGTPRRQALAVAGEIVGEMLAG